MYSWFLVAMQFGLAAWLVLSTPWRPFPWLAVILSLPGVVLATAAWFSIGLRNLRIHPSATAQTKLVTTGPYAIVRHPMYAGLLWFTASLLLVQVTGWRIIAWIVLLWVLRTKSMREERSMADFFENYGEYRAKVGSLFPKR